MKIQIVNAQIILPNKIIKGNVILSKGVIAEVSENAIDSFDGIIIDAENNYLSPGFVDVHTHGAANEEFMLADAEGVYSACRMHLRHGTTTIVPTTLSGSREQLLSFVKFFNTLDMKKRGCPEIAGLHLEGPYFAYEQKGAQNPEFLREPQKEEYEAVLNACNKIIRWSFAPELNGAKQFLQTLCDRGVVASLAHSCATCAEVEHAHKNGLAALTHFYSGMESVRRVNAYRVAGAVEAGYLLDDIYCEVIADGCHLPGELLRLIYKLKGADRICLVTDSMSAAGMPQGEYSLGAVRCIVEDGVAKLADRSAFAGSVATADRLVRTFKQQTSAPLYDCVKAASLTPARLIKLDNKKGSIEKDKDADLLIFDEDINIKKVFLRGEQVSTF